NLTPADDHSTPCWGGESVMRTALLLLIASAVPASGCSLMIAQCGKDLGQLSNRDAVHAEFGKPERTGREDGEEDEEFRYHGKVAADWGETNSLGMGWAMSFGLIEFVAFPRELFLIGKHTIGGQDIRFYFDDAGNVTGCSADGRSKLYLPKPLAAEP